MSGDHDLCECAELDEIRELVAEHQQAEFDLVQERDAALAAVESVRSEVERLHAVVDAARTLERSPGWLYILPRRELDDARLALKSALFALNAKGRQTP